MTQSDQTVCPRCGQPITFRKDGETIYPHQDNLVQVTCPLGGVNYYEAKRQVEEHRAAIKGRGDAFRAKR